MVSVFKDIYEIEKPENLEIDEVLRRIRTGEYGLAQIVDGIRRDGALELKKWLPVCLWQGEFNLRTDNGLVSYSGYQCFSVVCLFGDREREEQIRKIKMIDWIKACFLSPSGTELKLIVKVPADIDLDLHYQLCYLQVIEALEKKGITSSLSARSISQGCFLSYDPDIYINPRPTTFKFSEKRKIKKSTYRAIKSIPPTPVLTNFDNKDSHVIKVLLERWRNERDLYRPGSRIMSLLSQSGELCRAGIERDLAIEILKNLYLDEYSTFSPSIFSETIRKAYDMSAPDFGVDREKLLESDTRMKGDIDFSQISPDDDLLTADSDFVWQNENAWDTIKTVHNMKEFYPEFKPLYFTKEGATKGVFAQACAASNAGVPLRYVIDIYFIPLYSKLLPRDLIKKLVESAYDRVRSDFGSDPKKFLDLEKLRNEARKKKIYSNFRSW